MDTYSKEIIEYLLYIGILPKTALSNFNDLYFSFLNRYENNISLKSNNNNSSFIYSKNLYNDEFIIQALSTYIMNLTITQIKCMANNIIKNFIRNKGINKHLCLYNLINKYLNSNLKKYFNLWKNSYNKKEKKINKVNENNLNQDNINFYLNQFPFQRINNFTKKNQISKSFISDSKLNNINKTINKEDNSPIKYNLKDLNYKKNIINNENEMNEKLEIKKEKKKMVNKCTCLYYNNLMYPQKSFSQKEKKRKKNLSAEVTKRLYNDYSKYNEKKKKLQKFIDNERGITFKPNSFTHNSGYNVEGNFKDRNKQLLENRENFAFVYNYLRQKKINENYIGVNSSKKNNDFKSNFNYNEILKESHE